MTKETVILSNRELDRVSIIRNIVDRRLRQSQGAQQLGLSVHQPGPHVPNTVCIVALNSTLGHLGTEAELTPNDPLPKGPFKNRLLLVMPISA